jgi:hypothetical protein
MTPDQIAQARRHLYARIRHAQQPPLRGTPSALRELAATIAAGPPDITHLPPREQVRLCEAALDGDRPGLRQ